MRCLNGCEQGFDKDGFCLQCKQPLMKIEKLPEVTEIKMARLGPGDIVVFNCAGSLSHESARRLHDFAQGYFPNNKILVIGDGIEIKVIKSM